MWCNCIYPHYGNIQRLHIYYSAFLWQKETSDKNEISSKRVKCVFHFH